jgi:hypothetical protein
MSNFVITISSPESREASMESEMRVETASVPFENETPNCSAGRRE